MPALLVLVVISLCLNPSTSLYPSLHICAARLLPLRLWPAWRPRFTNRHGSKKTLHLPHHQRPSCRARTQCSSRTATISFYFDLRTATVFPASFHWLSTSPKKIPIRYHHRAALEHALHTRRLSIRSTAPLAFYSLYPCLVRYHCTRIELSRFLPRSIE